MTLRTFIGLGMLVVLAALLHAGCDDKGPNLARWAVGLYIKADGQIEETTVPYKQVPGQEPIPSTATFDSGPLVGQSTGTFTQTTLAQTRFEWMVVGQTETRQTTELRVDETERVPVFVVEERKVMNGSSARDERRMEWLVSEANPKGLAHVTTIASTTNMDNVTLASVYGLAGVDYLVRIDDLSTIWNDYCYRDGSCCDDEGCYWHNDSRAEFLTKYDASPGDFWVSPSGETLYHAIETESLSIGKNTVKALRVEVRQTGNVDTLNVADRCLREYLDTAEANTRPDHDSRTNERVTVPVLHLDPNCTGSYVHRKVGSEWWYQNTLVKEDSTYYNVTITDWGYEWLRADENGDKYRMKSRSRTTDVPANARPFVEFTQVTRKVTFTATQWEESDLYALPVGDDTGGLSGSPAIPLDGNNTGTPDGDDPDGDDPDGDWTDGDVPDGDDADGDWTDGDVPDGDWTDGDVPDGDDADGDWTDGDVTENCEEGQFECANGNCIPGGYVCDGDNDCGDESDEMDCE